MSTSPSSSNKADNDLEKVPFQSDNTRRFILLSYWIVVLIAVPFWWTTTSITRLPLPTSRVESLGSKQLSFKLNIALHSPSAERIGHILQETIKSRRLDAVLQADVHDIAHDSGVDYVVSLDKERSGAYVKSRTLTYGTQGLLESQIPLLIADTLSELLIANFDKADYDQRIVRYAQRYRLAFSLLHEDAASEQNPFSSWDIEAAISHELQPVLDRLAPLHNFSIESQVAFFAPLAFEPSPVDAEKGAFGLTHEQLTVFVNSAEWSLSSSVSNDPVLHFVVFIPSAKRRPLHIIQDDGSVSPSKAFILPQWGSIYIFNPPDEEISSPRSITYSDLHSAFVIFRIQLLALLGVYPLPPLVNSKDPWSDWQLDALMRRRASENTLESKQSLDSIVKLVHEIEGMPVGKDVQSDVQSALNSLDKIYAGVSQSPKLALQSSSNALDLASRAFFNPGMLALLYFPPEHNLAVYTPLLAPVAVPLLAAILREFSKWRKSRRT